MQPICIKVLKYMQPICIKVLSAEKTIFKIYILAPLKKKQLE